MAESFTVLPMFLSDIDEPVTQPKVTNLHSTCAGYIFFKATNRSLSVPGLTGTTAKWIKCHNSLAFIPARLRMLLMAVLISIMFACRQPCHSSRHSAVAVVIIFSLCSTLWLMVGANVASCRPKRCRQNPDGRPAAVHKEARARPTMWPSDRVTYFPMRTKTSAQITKQFD